MGSLKLNKYLEEFRTYERKARERKVRPWGEYESQSGGGKMERIWFSSRRKRNLTKNLEKILKKWKRGLKEYQDKTGDLGYGYNYTEKTLLGFFLWGCAQSKMHFLLELTTTRKLRGEDSGQGRADCWIVMDDKTDAIVESKRLFNCLDMPPGKKIFKKVELLKKELKSLKNVEDGVERIGLCFVILWRNKEKVAIKSNRIVLSKYLRQLKTLPYVDFWGVFQSPEEIVNDSNNVEDDTWIYPAIIVIGKYV